MNRIGLLVLLVAGAWLFPASSRASYHFTSVNEVFAGTTLDASAQFIEIKAYSAGQNLFSGRVLHIYDRNGVDSPVSFNRSLPSSANQMTVLIATASATTLLDVTPDFTMNAVIDRVGGKICFADPVDCFAWGSFSGADGIGGAQFGTKYDPSNGLPLGQSVIRDDGSDDQLQSTDDTNDSAADFDAGTPTPRNNAGVTGDYLASCGNSTQEGDEECDDGNNVNTDDCSVRCKDAICGDGIVQSADECDDGNNVDTDACRNDCQLPTCGDGLISTGEQCEPPDTATCTGGCLVINVGCGDGQPDAGEQCDDGNTASNDGCRGNCTIEACGDGIVDFNEDCDDGNTASGDSCRADCQNPGCGDGVVDSGETCDDGNIVVGDGCDAECLVEEDDHDHSDPTDEGNAPEDDGCASTRPNLAWLGVFLVLGAIRVRRRA